MSIHHPLFARLYAWMASKDSPTIARLRRELLAPCTGTVVEVGCGPGANFAHYPSAVTSVIAVEPEPYLRRIAQDAARTVDRDVTVIDSMAEGLALDSGTADWVVFSLVLCSVADPAAALREAHRVLAPTGQLAFLEHVAASTPWLGRAQRVVDATVWPWIGGNCHTHRDTVQTLTTNGFTVDRLRQFMFPDVKPPLVVSPHVIGHAHRPTRG